MPWIPVQDGLKQLRESRGWSILDLAEACEVSKRQLEQIESKKNPPSFIKPATVDAICQAFGLDLREWETWAVRDRWVVWRPHARRAESDDSAVLGLGLVGTLEARAKVERDLELHDRRVQTSRGLLPLLGLDWMSKVLTKAQPFDGKLFVVTGIVHQQSRMPSSSARVLGSEPRRDFPDLAHGRQAASPIRHGLRDEGRREQPIDGIARDDHARDDDCAGGLRAAQRPLAGIHGLRRQQPHAGKEIRLRDRGNHLDRRRACAGRSQFPPPVATSLTV